MIVGSVTRLLIPVKGGLAPGVSLPAMLLLLLLLLLIPVGRKGLTPGIRSLFLGRLMIVGSRWAADPGERGFCTRDLSPGSGLLLLLLLILIPVGDRGSTPGVESLFLGRLIKNRGKSLGCRSRWGRGGSAPEVSPGFLLSMSGGQNHAVALFGLVRFPLRRD